MKQLKVFKTHPDITIPVFATKQSACFDICCNSAGKSEYKGYSKQNSPLNRQIQITKGIVIMSGDRIMVPTGLIFDIPAGHSVRIHARSGLSLKQGLTLVNAEGVIDSDYVEEIFLLMTNLSDNAVVINNGDRVAQGELVKTEEYEIKEEKNKPSQKTERNGGMGSTGIKEIKKKKAKQLDMFEKK